MLIMLQNDIILQLHMVKSDEEINLLGQLVVSLTKEILDTNRNIQEQEKRITELEKKQSEPSEDKT
jgi:hypothetical protein